MLLLTYQRFVCKKMKKKVWYDSSLYVFANWFFAMDYQITRWFFPFNLLGCPLYLTSHFIQNSANPHRIRWKSVRKSTMQITAIILLFFVLSAAAGIFKRGKNFWRETPIVQKFSFQFCFFFEKTSFISKKAINNFNIFQKFGYLDKKIIKHWL